MELSVESLSVGKGKGGKGMSGKKPAETLTLYFLEYDMPNIFYPNSISQRHGEHPPDGVRSPQSAANAPLNGPYVCVDSARNLEATSAFLQALLGPRRMRTRPSADEVVECLIGHKNTCVYSC